MMFVRYDQGLVLFIFLHQIGTFLADNECMSSIPTVQYVPSCPSTEADWVIAAERKMCSSVGQNCTTPDNFVYHCLVNSFFNATLEVCAPVWKMNGYCPEFNVPGQRIQQVSERDCTKTSDKCPSQYNSSEVYKYPICFTLTHVQFQATTRQSIDVQSPHNEWKVHVLSIILIVMVFVLAVTSGILLVYIRPCRNAGSCRKIEQQEECEQKVTTEEQEECEQKVTTEEQQEECEQNVTTEDVHQKLISVDNLEEQQEECEQNVTTEDVHQKLISVDNLEGTQTSSKSNSGSENASTQSAINNKGKKMNTKYLASIISGRRASSSESTHSDDTHKKEEGFIVAAINFGTTHTKYGYSFVSDDSIPVNPKLYVQPTCILRSKPGGEFLFFGEKAIEESLNLENLDKHAFEDFSILDGVSKLKSYQEGINEELSNTFVDIFKCLKKKISEEVATKFPNKDITRWVLSVPFTWERGAEEFLKSTAKQAGIATNLQVVKEHQAILSWFSNYEGQENEEDNLFVDLGGASTSESLYQHAKSLLVKKGNRNVIRTADPNQAIIEGSIMCSSWRKRGGSKSEGIGLNK